MGRTGKKYKKKTSGGAGDGAEEAYPISDWMRTGPFALTFWDTTRVCFTIFQYSLNRESKFGAAAETHHSNMVPKIRPRSRISTKQPT
jgi:hypothetical protein